MEIFRNVSRIIPANSKSFFGALNVIFNRVDEKRVKEVGPDRACAEWLMRNGALVRWKGQPSPLTHYNLLPLDPKDTGHYEIEEVIAQESSISHHGFDHFCGCKCIAAMSFKECPYFDDRCIYKLSFLTDSLLCLEIKKCPAVCGEALLHIGSLKNLRLLKLCDIRVPNLVDIICQLKNDLPECHINP